MKGTCTHDVGSGVTLPCQVQGPRGEAGEDLHEIGQEAELRVPLH